MSFFALVLLAALISCSRSLPAERPSSSSVSHSASSESSSSSQYSYEAEIETIVNDMAACLDDKLHPVISQLAQADKEQLRELGMAGLAMYVQRLYELAKDEKAKSHDEHHDQ